MYPAKTIIMNVIMTVHGVFTIDIDVAFSKDHLVRNIVNKQIIDNMTLITLALIGLQR